jgi:hypothetical protein
LVIPVSGKAGVAAAVVASIAAVDNAAWAISPGALHQRRPAASTADTSAGGDVALQQKNCRVLTTETGFARYLRIEVRFPE